MIAISSAFWASAILGCQKPEKSPTSGPQIDITQLKGNECLSPIGLQEAPFLTSELPVSNPESWSLIEPDAPTYASGGVIVLDADEDKDFDIISFSQSQPHLFINDGTGQFTEDNTRLPQLPDRLYNGGSAADFDNDGDDDLYFSTSESADVFLEQTPNGFLDRSNDIGILQEPGYSAAAAWADMDLDGDLDLLVSGYGDDIITSSNGEFETAGPSHLYLNQSLYFVHQDALPPSVTPEPFTFSASWLPLDQSPPLDVLMANDLGPFVHGNLAYINNGSSWTDVSDTFGLNQKMFSMGLAITDWDSDDIPDIILTNIGDPVFLGTESGQRVDLTQSIGLMGTEEQITSWGALWLDVNNDATEDLWLGYGPLPLNDSETGPPNPPNQPDRLLLREDRQLIDMGEAWELDRRSNTRGGAMADFNGDGFVDMVRKPIDGPPELFMNQCNGHSWISITLEDLTGNRSAIGSTLRLTTENHSQLRWILAGGTSFVSSSPNTAYFGLKNDDQLIELFIEWPDGRTTQHANLNANHHVTIRRSD